MSTQGLFTRTLPYSVVGMVLLFASRALLAQNVINVPADQPTIQAGINAANNGDTVLVAPGTYPENINFQGKLIAVTSSGGPSVTIIDGGGIASVVTFNTGESSSAVLKGFTIQNGNAQNWLGAGGGIFADQTSPTITGNVIQNNVACGSGGGIESYFGSPVIENNTIRNNTYAAGCVAMNGAGIDLSNAGSAQIDGNTIINNTTLANGGGISLYAAGAPTITNNVISGNVAMGTSQASQGGGIFIVGDSDAVIAQNLIYNNSAGQGGAIFSATFAGVRGPVVVNNTMFGDSSTSQGSEVYTQTDDGRAQFFNNLMIAPAGQNAVYCDGTFSLKTPTFSHNDAFSSNGTSLAGICAGQSGQNGNISIDPQFVNASAGDFHLQPSSPAIDVGINAAPSLPGADYDGNPRILDGNNDCVFTVDLGAYELARAANVSFSPSQLAFSSQVIGFSSSPQTATLMNSGAGCFKFSGTQITGDFSLFNSCYLTFALPGGSSCVYSITFTPTASGTRTGTLTVTGSDGVTKRAPAVSLSGTGLTPPAVALSATSLTFGPQIMGTQSPAQAITLTNTGQASLSIFGINVASPFSETNTCPGLLAGGASCTISVSFAALYVGTQSSILSISDDASGSLQTVALSGTSVDFSVSASPTSASMKHGLSTKFSIGVAPVAGPFNASVGLSCSDLPSFATCSFSPSSVVPGANGAASSLTLSTSPKTPRGTFNVFVIGQSGSLGHSAIITLTVK